MCLACQGVPEGWRSCLTRRVGKWMAAFVGVDVGGPSPEPPSGLAPIHEAPPPQQKAPRCKAHLTDEGM
jgi:hypothetical protein